MRIGIVGLGFVGLTFASTLANRGYDVIGMDIDKAKIRNIESGKVPFYEPKLENVLKNALKKKLILTENIEEIVVKCDFIFLTLGTPMNKNGNIDLKIILTVCKKIGQLLLKLKNRPTIIIKSTVTPGTTNNQIKKILEKESNKKVGKGFGLITNPEFLREGKAVEDTLNPHLIVIGSNEKYDGVKLEKFYEKFHNKKKSIIITNNTTAEIIKYANNSFLATKISFINNISNLCQTLPGTNVDQIAEAIGIDPRIGNQFLKAGPGYGGSCLPKDVQALIACEKSLGVESTLLNAVHQTNVLQIQKIIKLVEKTLVNVKNQRITILGLSFKEESDDIRESRSIKLIEILLKKQSNITVHDPKAIKNTKLIFKDKISYNEKIGDAINDSDCVILMTPWKQYSKLQGIDFKKMKNKNIIDTRRILNIHDNDINYIGLGIGY